jgi:hypothetical protein
MWRVAHNTDHAGGGVGRGAVRRSDGSRKGGIARLLLVKTVLLLNADSKYQIFRITFCEWNHCAICLRRDRSNSSSNMTYYECDSVTFLPEIISWSANNRRTNYTTVCYINFFSHFLRALTYLKVFIAGSSQRTNPRNLKPSRRSL